MARKYLVSMATKQMLKVALAYFGEMPWADFLNKWVHLR